MMRSTITKSTLFPARINIETSVSSENRASFELIRSDTRGLDTTSICDAAS
jgi:hypothetical protein